MMNHRFCSGEARVLLLCIFPNRNQTPVEGEGPESAVKTVAGSAATPVIYLINGSERKPSKE